MVELYAFTTDAGSGYRGAEIVRVRLRLLSLVTVAAIAVPAHAAKSPAYAPLNRPGPALSVSATDLKAALHCEGDFHNGHLEPVLLSPGTSATPKQNFSW